MLQYNLCFNELPRKGIPFFAEPEFRYQIEEKHFGISYGKAEELSSPPAAPKKGKPRVEGPRAVAALSPQTGICVEKAR